MIYNADVFEILPKIESCSQNLVYSDFPYNLGTRMGITKEGKVDSIGKAVDFMNTKWDGLTGENFEVLFSELFRVLKYGGFCCVWSMSRQSLAPLYYANKAGFEQLQSINSFFISSFPKAMDLSKALDRYYGEEREVVGKKTGRASTPVANIKGGKYIGYEGNIDLSDITAPSSNLAKKYDGYKSSIVPLKEVSETLLVFRKPFKYKSIIPDIIAKEENNESDIHGFGINIDGNRVPTSQNDKKDIGRMINRNIRETDDGWGMQDKQADYVSVLSESGRYPSNLYLIDGFNYTPEQIKEILTNKQLHIFENIGIDIEPLEYMTEEKQIEYICNYLDKFEVSKILDEQSGHLKSGAMDSQSKGQDDETFNTYGKQYVRRVVSEGDEGGCSRILHKCKYELQEYNIFNYTTKVSSFERNAGCDGLEEQIREHRGNNQGVRYCIDCGLTDNGSNDHSNCSGNFNYKLCKTLKNNHPTLKNMNLQYKIMNLFLCPKEDIKDFKILIPFCGVQSEYMSAMALGIPEENITGIEISKEYCEIGEARKAYWTKHNFYFKEDKKEAKELKENAIKKDSQITGKKLF